MKPNRGQNWVSIFLLVFVFLCLIAYQSVEDNVFYPIYEVENLILEPVRTETVENGRDIYYFSIEDITQMRDTLVFYTNHQEVFAYIDGNLTYSLESEPSIFGGTSGAKWNIITLPLTAEEIEVHVSQVYPELAKQEIVFELGNPINIYYQVMNDSAWEIMLAMCIIIIGFALFLYWMLVFRKTNQQREVLYLGLFALIFGIWNFGETKFAIFLFDKRAYWSYLAFTCLMTMCMPALFFFREFLEVKDKYVYRGIALYIVLETVICQLLHFTGIKGVKETAPFTMVSIVLILCYLLFAIIIGIVHKKNMRKIMINIIGLVILVITAAIDISAYFVNILTANKVAKFGFLIYTVILGIETAQASKNRLQEEQKMELLREMAVKDMLTGCYNRNAYNQTMDEITSMEGVQIIGFDLNNLKKCNDTMGHMAGDQYIRDAAQVIGEIFEDFGKIYRIGGDEFCIVTKGVSLERFEKKKKKLREAIEAYRREHTDYEFGIACGFATYDKKLDQNLEELRHRADLSMYENKKEIKAVN